MFQIGDMVKVTTRSTNRIGWVRRVTAKRVTVEASNGTERRAYAHGNVELLHRRDPRSGMFVEDATRSPVSGYRKDERIRLRERLASDEHSRVEDGVLYWIANNSPVPSFVFEDAGYLVPERQRHSYQRHLDKTLGNYHRAQANLSEEARAEQAFEMRAAFGPGVEVVDVISGRRYRT